MLNLLFRGLLITLLSNTVVYASTSHSAGALIFKVNCSLCHGALGLGDGYYPGLVKLGNTNLLDITKNTTNENLVLAIGKKSIHQQMSEFKPLTSDLNKKLVTFLEFYFKSPREAFRLLNKTVVYKLPNYSVGEATYRRRCVICHGIKGDGKGRLSKIIKNPSPFDLRQSPISDGLVRQIIEEGGVKQGRNSTDTMPAFKNEISQFELESVILYIKNFRTQTQL